MTGVRMIWADLVTTALLGTSRRPLSTDDGSMDWAPSTRGGDDAVRLLDLAAAHRTLVAIGEDPGSAQPAAVAPAQRRAPAPPVAARLLEQLMDRPDPSLIGFWLESCVAAERTPAAVHWTWLARAAHRSTAYDRVVLGRALGEQGRWFVRQNPEWRRLAADLTAGALTPSPPPRPANPSVASSTLSAEELAADPDRLFDQPTPWPTELVAAAWTLLGTGVLGVKAHNYAVRVGLAMPVELYPRLGDAAAYYLQAPEASPALRRDIRHNFVQLERAAYARVEIAAAFAESSDQEHNREVVDRVEIPHV